MGVFSRYHRFREAGEGVNIYNVEQYGKPVRSLFTSAKVFTLHKDIDIMDEEGTVVYRSRSKFFSIRDKTDVTDANGAQVAHIERKILTLHERHYVTMADGTRFEMASELFHLVKDIVNIEGLDWQLRGNIVGLNFALFDRDGGVIAVVSQKLLSLHDKYCVDIYKPEHERTVVTILVTLQHMVRDRRNAASSSSSSDD